MTASVLAVTALGIQTKSQAGDNEAIVIRPTNYDPDDELAYTRLKGEVEQGKAASGKVWNQPESDSRAAAASVAPSEPAPAGAGAALAPAASGPSEPRLSYAAAYAQIPFSRSEYEANPSYRHDAAMELMMGAMRPTTIMRQTSPYFSRYPDMFRYAHPAYPYPYSGGGTSNTNMWWRTSLIAY